MADVTVRLSDTSIYCATKWRRAVRFTGFVFCLLAITAFGCTQTRIPNLQVFSNRQILEYLRQHSVQGDFLGDAQSAVGYWQDVAGMGVYVTGEHNLYLLRENNNEPLRLAYPSNKEFVRHFWIDPNNQIKFLPPYALSESNGDVWTVVDEQSGYFSQWKRKEKITYVGHMASHAGWLFSTNTGDFVPDQVFAEGNVIYLLDHQNSDIPPPLFFHKNCWAFAPEASDSTRYIKMDEFSLPGTVMVVDPFSPRCVCYGYGFVLSPSRPFLYDLQKHQIICQLPDESLMVFLDGDWLGPRLGK
jgi:hypothetical protein